MTYTKWMYPSIKHSYRSITIFINKTKMHTQLVKPTPIHPNSSSNLFAKMRRRLKIPQGTPPSTYSPIIIAATNRTNTPISIQSTLTDPRVSVHSLPNSRGSITLKRPRRLPGGDRSSANKLSDALSIIFPARLAGNFLCSSE